jgi:hypothetical protein
MEYGLLVDIEVFEYLAKLKPSLRNRLVEQFKRIQSYPAHYAEYTERDPSGRRIDVCVYMGLAIHYWEDFADRHVKILAVTSAGS